MARNLGEIAPYFGRARAQNSAESYAEVLRSAEQATAKGASMSNTGIRDIIKFSVFSKTGERIEITKRGLVHQSSENGFRTLEQVGDATYHGSNGHEFDLGPDNTLVDKATGTVYSIEP